MTANSATAVEEVSRFETVGAPSLRFLQGRARCCRYHGLLCPADSTVPMGCTTCTSSPARATSENRCWAYHGRATASSLCSSKRASNTASWWSATLSCPSMFIF